MNTIQLTSHIFLKPLLLFANTKFVSAPNSSSKNSQILVSNHISMVDFLLVPASFSLNDFRKSAPVFTMTANKYMDLPVLGEVLRAHGGFPAKPHNRYSHGVSEAVDRIKSGNLVVIFPTGGLPISGIPRPAKKGIEVIVSRTRARIRPIYIHRRNLWHTIPIYTVVTGPEFDGSGMSAEQIMQNVSKLIDFVPSRRL